MQKKCAIIASSRVLTKVRGELAGDSIKIGKEEAMSEQLRNIYKAVKHYRKDGPIQPLGLKRAIEPRALLQQSQHNSCVQLHFRKFRICRTIGEREPL